MPDAAPSPYATEAFNADERAVLHRYFTNVDRPVFALVNLPEVVKGALFARYSRSAKSLRRLFLDEFASDLVSDDTEGVSPGTAAGATRAEQLYDRVFFEYGDDSVAQLGGVHLACEQASNVLTKVLEWGRLASYLEQSTRYIAYNDRRSDGTWRYYHAPEIVSSPLGERYSADMDAAFGDYSELLEHMTDYFARTVAAPEPGAEGPWRRAVRAKALDTVRGLLPAAALSNVGIYASGQAYEAMLLRMFAHPLPEVRSYAQLILAELRKVIPSFMRRVDLPDRGLVTAAYYETNRNSLAALAAELVDPSSPPEAAAAVTLVDWDPDAEVKLVAAALYPYCDRSELELRARAQTMTCAQRQQVLDAFTGERANRRQRPGRALELPVYRFDVLGDYGAFRDLQRHRMCTIDWQTLTPAHGYLLPADIAAAGAEDRYAAAIERSAALHDALVAAGFAAQAPYAVSLAYRVRFSMTFNAREAMHMLELRSGPAGHDSYRRVAQDMHTQIAEVAGHRAVAAMMSFVDHSRPDSQAASLNRLAAETAAEARRARATLSA